MGSNPVGLSSVAINIMFTLSVSHINYLYNLSNLCVKSCIVYIKNIKELAQW